MEHQVGNEILSALSLTGLVTSGSPGSTQAHSLLNVDEDDISSTQEGKEGIILGHLSVIHDFKVVKEKGDEIDFAFQVLRPSKYLLHESASWDKLFMILCKFAHQKFLPSPTPRGCWLFERLVRHGFTESKRMLMLDQKKGYEWAQVSLYVIEISGMLHTHTHTHTHTHKLWRLAIC